MVKGSRAFRLGIDGGLACSPRPTGVEFYARSLLLGLLATVPKWTEVHLYLPPGAEKYGFQGNCKIHYRPEMNMRLKDLWLAYRTWRDGIDALYAFGHKIPRGCRTRLIPTLHDTIYEDFPQCYPAGIPERMRKEVADSVRRAALMSVNSHTTAASLRQHYGWTGTTVVTGAAARDIFCPAIDLDSAPTETKEPFFLYVGRIDERKNAVRLVEAYRRLISDGLRCKLVLVGPDDDGSRRLNEALGRGVVAGEKIERPGYLAESQLLNLYREACAFVYPSLAEGFGMPILEAMACGTPVITSNCSALLEVADQAALLIDPTSTEELVLAMKRLLQNPDDRQLYRRAGLQRSALFNWKDCGRAFWTGLEEFARLSEDSPGK